MEIKHNDTTDCKRLIELVNEFADTVAALAKGDYIAVKLQADWVGNNSLHYDGKALSLHRLPDNTQEQDNVPVLIPCIMEREGIEPEALYVYYDISCRAWLIIWLNPQETKEHSSTVPIASSKPIWELTDLQTADAQTKFFKPRFNMLPTSRYDLVENTFPLNIHGAQCEYPLPYVTIGGTAVHFVQGVAAHKRWYHAKWSYIGMLKHLYRILPCIQYMAETYGLDAYIVGHETPNSSFFGMSRFKTTLAFRISKDVSRYKSLEIANSKIKQLQGETLFGVRFTGVYLGCKGEYTFENPETAIMPHTIEFECEWIDSKGWSSICAESASDDTMSWEHFIAFYIQVCARLKEIENYLKPLCVN